MMRVEPAGKSKSCSSSRRRRYASFLRSDARLPSDSHCGSVLLAVMW